MKEFKELLMRYETTLCLIERRLYALEAIDKSFSTKLAGERFMVKNDIILLMRQDSYEMLINDLVSLVKPLFKGGGFLNQLNDCLSYFRVPGKGKITSPKGTYTFLNYTPSEDEIKEMKKKDNISFKKEYQESVRKTIVKLFPRLADIKDHTSNEFKVSQKDIKNLKERFHLKVDSLDEYRDNVAAHKYENKAIVAKIPGPTLQEIRKLCLKLEEFFNNIRSVFDQSTYGYTDLNFASTDGTADDITDLILLGSVNSLCNKFGMSEKIGGTMKAQTESVYFYQFRSDYWANNKVPEPKEKGEGTP